MADPTKPRGDVLMEWTFPEFHRHDRSRGWYIGFFVTILVLIGLAILTANYTFIGVIVLTAFIILIRLRRYPPDVSFAIHEEGIDVGQKFYEWREFKDFWILYRPPEVKKLYLEFKSIRPGLDVALEQQNPLQIRQLLSEHLLENTEKEEEPFGDQLTRFLKI